MRVNNLKSDIAQRTLSDLQREYHTSCKSIDLTYPLLFFPQCLQRC
jgi:hypothetical protein